jgi:hypothetical protein
MKSKKNQLTQRQQQVIPHILSSSSYEEAARRANISSKQIHKWLQDPAFKNELLKRRTQAYNEALYTLKTSSTKAVETLTTLLIGEDPKVRLTAADKILTHALKGVEYLGFEERLNEVEGRIALALKAERIP